MAQIKLTPQVRKKFQSKHTILQACTEAQEDPVNSPREAVNGPAHYNGRECLDWIKAGLSAEEYIGGLKFNIFKYNWRYKDKGGLEDLRKALFYQKEMVDFLNGSLSTTNG